MEHKRVSFDKEKLFEQVPTIRREPSSVGRYCGEVNDFIARNPTSAVLTAFGVGLGLGVLLCQVVPTGERRSWESQRASALGRHLWEALCRQLPESVAERVAG